MTNHCFSYMGAQHFLLDRKLFSDETTLSLNVLHSRAIKATKIYDRRKVVACSNDY